MRDIVSYGLEFAPVEGDPLASFQQEHGRDWVETGRDGGDFLRGFNSTELPVEQYGIAADFTPSGGWRAMALKNVENVVVDRVFGTVANDLVVPTAGVYQGDDAMQVREDRRLVLPKARGVYHGSFFGQPDVAKQIAGWLTG